MLDAEGEPCLGLRREGARSFLNIELEGRPALWCLNKGQNSLSFQTALQLKHSLKIPL